MSCQDIDGGLKTTGDGSPKPQERTATLILILAPPLIITPHPRTHPAPPIRDPHRSLAIIGCACAGGTCMWDSWLVVAMMMVVADGDGDSDCFRAGDGGVGDNHDPC